MEWDVMERNGIKIGLQQFLIKFKLGECPGHWSSCLVTIVLGRGKSKLKLSGWQHPQKIIIEV